MLSRNVFWKECLQKCLDKIKNNKWKNVNVLRDILLIFRDELNGLIFPYLCVLGVYTVWLLVLMICNTFLLWSLCQKLSGLGIFAKSTQIVIA